MSSAPGERAPTLATPVAGDKRRRRAFLWAGIASGPVAWGLARLAGLRPELTEAVWTGGAGPAVAWALARVTGIFPFSLAEWALAGFACLLGWRLVRALRSPARRWRALGGAALLGLRDLSLALAVFMIVFGFQYRRPTLADRMGWDQPLGSDLLARCADEALVEVNERYRQLHGVDDAGTATARDDFSELDAALERAWPAVARQFRLGRVATWGRGPTKGPLLSPVMARLGLGGFYFPWTGEANRNRIMPLVREAHAAAHEKAHQRGIAREDEANFLGWAVARRCEDPRARYAAALYAHRRLLIALGREDPDRARQLLERRLPGVQRDVDDLHAYWERYRGPAADFASNVNDQYLRHHAIPDGTASYGRSLRLLLLYAASRGGSLAP